MAISLRPLHRPGVASEAEVRVSPFHEQLLMFALIPGERSVDSWERLRAHADELWDPETRQLLPLLSRSLVEARIDAPELPELMQIARGVWLDNQLLFRRVASAIETLRRAGVATLALKGVPLALTRYPDPSLRPMVDFDVLVHPHAAADAVASLQGAGWTVEWSLHEDFVARTTEVPCRSPDGQGILDLHWRLVPWVGRSWTADDLELWHRATRLDVLGESTLAPAPDDLLLHVLLHAFRSGWANVPRWVADGVVLLRSAGDTFDWDRFLDRVITGHVVLPVGAALDYLERTFRAPIPRSVRSTLGNAPATRRETKKYRVASRPITTRRHWLSGEAGDLRTSWSRISINYTRGSELRSLGPFLRGRTHVDHIWALPAAVVRRRIGRDQGDDYRPDTSS